VLGYTAHRFPLRHLLSGDPGVNAVIALSIVVLSLSCGRSVAISSLAEGMLQNASSSGVLTLDTAMVSLSRIVSRSKVTVTAGNGKPFSDPEFVDQGTWTQSKFQFDNKQPCLITFDETAFLHYSDDPLAGTNAGKTILSGERHFLWLPAINPSEIKVVELKTWANDDEATDSSVPASPDAAYGGFVVITMHSSEVIAIAPIKKSFPNPSSFRDIRKADRIFFTTRADAEDAKNLISYAALVTRQLTGAQRCVPR
jgi:hypothetical protein